MTIPPNHHIQTKKTADAYSVYRRDTKDHPVNEYGCEYRLDQPMDRRRGGWIISFTDLMAIMLSFFVLIFSMSSPTQQEWQAVSSSFEQSFKRLDQQLFGHAGPSKASNITPSLHKKAESLDYIQTILEGMIARLPPEYAEQVFIEQHKDRLMLFAPKILRFAPQNTELTDQGKGFLKRLAMTLKAFDNQIMIIGHASESEMDNTSNKAPPLGSDSPETQYPQILSFNRGFAVASILRQNGYDEEAIVMGMGANRAVALPNAFNQQQKDIFLRRADLVILKQSAK